MIAVPEFAQFVHEFLGSPETAASQVIATCIQGTPRYHLIAAQKYHQGNAIVTVGIDVTERQQYRNSPQTCPYRTRSPRRRTYRRTGGHQPLAATRNQRTDRRRSVLFSVASLALNCT
uniref:Uncharacterized protein n=1 Tax=Desertifilum tharense IPPAS B-1220 TaxID=1781255 RepID=A0ACD5H2W1_9CYAN